MTQMGFEPKLILNLFASSGSQSGMIVQINWKVMGATTCKKKTKTDHFVVSQRPKCKSEK